MAKKVAISLFSGAGGDTLGLINSNYHVLAFSEFNKSAIKTHLKAFLDSHLIMNESNDTDIKKIPDSVFVKYKNKIDLIFAGFPCFVKDTKILTFDGYKNIQDITLEDKLLTHTGKFQQINNLQTKIYNGKLFNIKIKYHPEIITCTEGHPFYVRERKKIWNNQTRKYNYKFDEPKWIKAKELTDNHYYGMVINTKEIIPEFTFDKKVTIKLDKKEYWFLMGYFIGNGWIEHRIKNNRLCHTIRFVINNQDENEIVKIIKKVLPITDSGKCKTFGCNDFIWYNILKQFGKLISEWIQDSPKEFIQEFINGYMKANGNIKNNGFLKISTVSYNLAFGLQRLYLKLGHIFSISKTNRPTITIIENRIDNYEIKGYLSRKKNISSFIDNNYVWYKPFKIETQNTTNTQVYNFEVSTDNSYCVENIIVKNCQGFSNAGKKNENDPRNELIFEFVRIVNVIKPKWFIGENVSGLLSRQGIHPKNKQKMPVINIIQSIFNDIGYSITWNIVSALDYNVPQDRKRLIIIGHKNESNILYPHFDWERSFSKSKKPKLRHIIENTLDGAIEFPKKNIPKNLDTQIWIKTYLKSPPQNNIVHPNLIRLVQGIRNKSKEEIKNIDEEKTIIVPNGLISFNKRISPYHGQICHPDSPSKTIICTYATCPRLFVGFYNENLDKYWIRPFTITELAQIQGFPKNYPFCGTHKEIISQIGNAVPPPIIQSISNSLDSIIFKNQPQNI
jgi:DNA (cytosine-5)-methyltransferase 1